MYVSPMNNKSQLVVPDKQILWLGNLGNFHDGVISIFVSYLNLVIPARYERQKP